MLREFAGVDGARLIDAHSFCWMLVKLSESTSAPSLPKVTISPPEPLDDIAAMARTAGDGASRETALVSESEFTAIEKNRRRLGLRAQDIAMESERERLRAAGRADLANRVAAVWEQIGLGYDIASFEEDGSPRAIEVKAVQMSARALSFFLTDNEWRKSRELSNYYFYLVHDCDSERPKVYSISAAQVPLESLRPQSYKATLTHALVSAQQRRLENASS